jgi:hypothetical protein
MQVCCLRGSGTVELGVGLGTDNGERGRISQLGPGKMEKGAEGFDSLETSGGG